ncbi:hypothetical protein [Anaerospora hongkongensis]|uniref:hypothetical protein n=1 Tax=Anaerospora hongkongensis TaxID=244830 RepID=UPI001A9F279E|nr:hypothetical protein [Anaerospora hongkongensis]
MAMRSDRKKTVRKGVLTTKNIRLNQNIFASSLQPLFTKTKTTDPVKYSTFNVLSSPIAVWTPASETTINLTAVQAAAPLGITITLSSDSGNPFLSFRLTQAAAVKNLPLPSAYRLAKGNSIFVRTSDEQSTCTTFGGATATQVAFNGRSDFTNVSNAVGLDNGQVATLSSAVLNQTGGRINLTYSMSMGDINQFQIKSVVVKCYCRLALTLAVGTSTMTFYWRPSSAVDWLQLQQVSLSLVGTADYLTTPLTQDITASVLAATNPWDVIANMQTSFTGLHTGLGLGNSIQLDAIEVEVCVTGINKLTLFGYET